MTVLHWINSHKTKITGFVIVVLGAVQANAAHLGTVLTPKQYAIAMVCVGVLVSALGFINTALASRPEAP